MIIIIIIFIFKGNKWFGDDGRIMALPDPIKESSTRPPLFHMEEDLDPALQTVYRKVRLSQFFFDTAKASCSFIHRVL